MSGDERINASPVCIFQIIVALYQSRTPLGRYLYDRCHLGSLCQNTKKSRRRYRDRIGHGQRRPLKKTLLSPAFGKEAFCIDLIFNLMFL